MFVRWGPKGPGYSLKDFVLDNQNIPGTLREGPASSQ